ncbi:flagellar filament capping protein FliD [Ammoniphilus sp. 3BR4]|uniref:flagellar filament capping protein FliD n=1 Tax=Ammoniphilus sp. 3BR4 TaxID=3158265 RepID=UPI0034650C38
MRITGLVSGMDTDTLIRDLMKAERAPVDRLQAKKVTLGWQQDAFRSINSKFLELRTMMQDLRFSGNFNNKMILSSSNEQALKVEVGGTVQAGTVVVDRIDRLASYGSVTSNSVNNIVKLEGTALTSPLSVTTTNNSFVMELGGVAKTITLDIPEDGSAYTIGNDGTLIGQLQQKIDRVFGAGKVNVAFDATNEKLNFIPSGTTGFEPQLLVKTSGSSTLLQDLGFTNNQSFKIGKTTTIEELQNRLGADTFSMTGDQVSFAINNITFTANKTDTIDSLMNQVNSSAAGVTMSFDEQSGKFSFRTKATGSNSQINFSGDDNLFLQKIGITGTSYAGTDAEFTINGLTTQRNSNTFTMDGITYTLLQTTTSPINVSSRHDTDEIFNKIKGFVDKYNEIVADVSTKLTEKKYRDFTPLTDEQKHEMKEKEIELWEEKAKSGLLRNDSILSSARDSMRQLLSQPVEGLNGFKILSEIGITTSANYRDNGKLVIDEGKLREAISNNLDQVVSLFTAKGGSANQNGIAQRLYDSLNTTIDRVNKKAGFANSSVSVDSSLIGKDISRLTTQIFSWEQKLMTKEDRYYKQFAAMEKALNNMNSQSSWLLTQFGMGMQ